MARQRQRQEARGRKNEREKGRQWETTQKICRAISSLLCNYTNHTECSKCTCFARILENCCLFECLRGDNAFSPRDLLESVLSFFLIESSYYGSPSSKFFLHCLHVLFRFVCCPGFFVMRTLLFSACSVLLDLTRVCVPTVGPSSLSHHEARVVRHRCHRRTYVHSGTAAVTLSHSGSVCDGVSGLGSRAGACHPTAVEWPE